MDAQKAAVTCINETFVKSTLVEPPPDFDDDDEEGIEFIRAESINELAEQTQIGNEEVLDRVLLPGKRFGSYDIIGFVAAGGMGEIYAARRIKSDGRKSRPVALKVITSEYANDWRIIERFKREAKISKAIRSRHVARVYEFGESPKGHVFLAMELLNGEELFDRLHRKRLMSAMTVTELTLQILKGLHQIHESGFVHRDIKPENVFLATNPKTNDEMVKIIDFGIAKRAANKSDPLLSVAGQIYGTPQYIAPEQAVNPDVDQRADLYSVGILMYECVTGCLPFEGESSYETIVAHQTEDVPALPSSIDPGFAEIVYTALAKTPDMRFQSALEMGRTLRRWLDETSWVEEEEGDLVLPDDLELTSIAADEPSDAEVSAEAADPLADTMAAELDPPSAKEIPVPAQIQELSSSTANEPSAADAKSPAPRRDSPPQSQASVRSEAAHRVAEAPSTGEIAAPMESTTELRSPRNLSRNEDVSESDARTAQVITGIALGFLILAVLYIVFL